MHLVGLEPTTSP